MTNNASTTIYHLSNIMYVVSIRNMELTAIANYRGDVADGFVRPLVSASQIVFANPLPTDVITRTNSGLQIQLFYICSLPTQTHFTQGRMYKC